MLKTRVITAVLLLAVLLPALFYPAPEPFCALALVFITAAGWEWGRLNGCRQPVSVLLAVTCLLLCLAAWALGWLWAPSRTLWLVVGAAWVLGSWLGVYFGSEIQDPVSLGLDMVMGCFLLAMVIGGQKNLRMLVIWGVAAVSSLLAHRYLPENSHVVVGALAGGVLGAVWMEKKK